MYLRVSAQEAGRLTATPISLQNGGSAILGDDADGIAPSPVRRHGRRLQNLRPVNGCLTSRYQPVEEHAARSRPLAERASKPDSRRFL